MKIHMRMMKTKNQSFDYLTSVNPECERAMKHLSSPVKAMLAWPLERTSDKCQRDALMSNRMLSNKRYVGSH